jgi:hypothetical protein
MAMTKSQYKIEREQEAARQAKRKWLDEWLAAHRAKFAVTLQLTKEMYRWRSQQCEPRAIWMGAADYFKWTVECPPDAGPNELRDVPVRLVKMPGITFAPIPEAAV